MKMVQNRAARVTCLALAITMTSLVIEPTLALAQTAPSADAQAQAKKLKAEADKAMDDIQYADALKKYSQAFDSRTTRRSSTTALAHTAR